MYVLGINDSHCATAPFWGYQKLTGKILQPLADLYLGPEYSKTEIEKVIRGKKVRRKFQVKFYPRIEKKVAQILALEKVVGRSSGRMEWDARALGNYLVTKK